MSISSSFYADYANSIKAKWIEKLQEARDQEDWDKIDSLLNEMRDHYFSE